MARNNHSTALKLALAAAALALAHALLVSDEFRPIKVTADLTLTSQRHQLEGPWDLRSDARFPGVMSAFDRGRPVDVLVTLPSADQYKSQLRFKFHNIAQTIEVRANGIPLTIIHPSRCGSAEKFTLHVPQKVLVAGVNRISFTNTGVPGGTEYEAVRFQNYLAVLVKNQAYLLPASQRQLLQKLLPYRVVCRSELFWLIAGIVLAIGCVTVIVPVLVRRGIERLRQIRWRRPVRRPAKPAIRRAARPAGPRLLNAVICSGKNLLQLGVRLLGNLQNLLQLGIHLLGSGWRRLLAAQRPEAYAKLFYVLVGIALAGHWMFHWELFARLVGWLAAFVLVIAVAWEMRLPRSVGSVRGGPPRALERRLRLAVLLGTAVLLAPLLSFPVTTGFAEGDAFFAKPHEAIKQAVLSGQFPLWDPSSGGGESMLADPSSTQFYPPVWLTFLAPTAHTALWWITYLHLIAAAVGSYVLACWIGCHPIAAILAPLGFVFNQYVSTMLVNGGFPILCAFTWLSWGTALLWRGATQDSLRFLVGAGVCLTVQVFGGMGYEMQFPILLYGLLLVITALSRPIPWRQRIFQLGRQTFVVFGCAVGLSAIKLLPAAQFLKMSTRGGWSLADVEAQASPALGNLADLLLSKFFEVMPAWGPGAQWVSWIYAALMVVALWSLCRKETLWRPALVFFLGLVVACWVTMGSRAPIDLLAVLYHLLPAFRGSASAPRILILTRLVIPILAAIGASMALRGLSARAPWLRRLTQRGVIAFGIMFAGCVYAPFITFVMRNPVYGHVEHVRTGFLATLAEAPEARVEGPSDILHAQALLKNIGDEPWPQGTAIQWKLNGRPFQISAITQRVTPGGFVRLQFQGPLPSQHAARPPSWRLSVGVVGGFLNGREDLWLADIEPLTSGSYRAKLASATVEAVLSGEGILGRCPEDWNALLGALSRWHAPNGVRVYSECSDVYPYTALLHGFQMDTYANSTVRPRYVWPLRFDADGIHGLRRLRMTNVRYLLLPADRAARLGPDQTRLLKTGAGVNLYELTSALPRVWFPAAAALLIGNDGDRDAGVVEPRVIVSHPTFDPSVWAIFCRPAACLDDFTLDEIKPFSALLLTHPKIRDPHKAKLLLDAYRQTGGRVMQLPSAGYRYASSRDVPGSILDDGLPALTFGSDANAGLSALFAAIPQRDIRSTRMVIERETLTYRRFRIETARDTIPLVMSEADFPGWHAAIDGQQAPLYTANGMIRGVMLKGAGAHTVEVWYSPPALWSGGAVTLVFALGLLTWWGTRPRRLLRHPLSRC